MSPTTRPGRWKADPPPLTGAGSSADPGVSHEAGVVPVFQSLPTRPSWEIFVIAFQPRAGRSPGRMRPGGPRFAFTTGRSADVVGAPLPCGMKTFPRMSSSSSVTRKLALPLQLKELAPRVGALALHFTFSPGLENHSEAVQPPVSGMPVLSKVGVLSVGTPAAASTP